MTSDLLTTFAASLLLVVVMFAGVLAYGARTHRYTLVDAVWGAGFAAISVLSLLLSLGRGPDTLRLLLTVLTVLWGLRLAVHITRRSAGKPEDPRYVDLFERHGGHPVRTAVRRIALPQGAVMWFVSLPVQVGIAVEGPELSGPVVVVVVLGVLAWLVGMVFEVVGDVQLDRFKADASRRGTVLDTGLWRYTRHPNYFGDACVWWGLWLVAAAVWPGVLTVLSPVAMTLFLTRVTGKALTERRMSGRPGYAEYVARTSGFVPRPPRPRS